MAKLYFYYGVMGSSKSANALMAAFNYTDRGQQVLLVKPSTDTRTEGTIASRVGLEQKCIMFSELTKIDGKQLEKYDCIIVDEAQFLSEGDVDLLSGIVDGYNIPVMCYGLRTDFKGHLFSGSKRLMEIADSIIEIKTVCWCGRKAIMNARLDSNGEVVRCGQQIQIGANESYTGLCRKHWREGNTGRNRN